ncbi:class I SAM-dependent methyltransferase [Paenibacillus sp. N1-5-1-14]|uniref:class I SAM-dependent methyltransferase n=1 Tax=Paenibacillus radicibacter TaxID=2972488 RepID=UPI002158E360|nr:class I SAM-dependent methyltransferase [Paenibacillus radicibacter]MCR8644607.1 class I SAM-dependent methyltransferase [Paenibacillus radicibacter]
MNTQEYKKFYDEVGREIGWDFSKLKISQEGVKWDFYKEVVEACKPTDVLLDVGTGGGEALLSIADQAQLLIGIDLSAGMIETAKRNLQLADIHNVRFLEMDVNQLMFPDHFFQVISCRQSVFNAREVTRVLTNDGVFFTQQVRENDKLNLKMAFGRGQAYGTPAGTLQNQYVNELRKAGLADIQVLEYDAAEYYETSEDLIFLLKHTPIIPNFGKEERDFEILEQFIKENKTDKGIRTNSARFMIVAR